MKKQNYSTFTSYLSKTHKNVDLYRLYNPHFQASAKATLMTMISILPISLVI